MWEEIIGERNSFLFEFGHGLGVWKKAPVAESDPEFLQKLMGAGEAERRDINRFYANAAAALALWHGLNGQPETIADVSRLRQESEEKESRITDLEHDVQTKTDQIAQLQNAIETKAGEIAGLRQQVETGIEKAAQLNQEIARQKSELQRENDKQSQLIETLKGQVEQKDDRLARASKDLLDAQWEALTLRGEALRKAESVDPALSHALELQNRAEVAESDREHLREMVTGLQKDLERTERSLHSSEDELKAARAQLQADQAQLETSARDLRSLQKQMDRLKRSFSGKLILPFGKSQRKLQELTASPRAND